MAPWLAQLERSSRVQPHAPSVRVLRDVLARVALCWLAAASVAHAQATGATGATGATAAQPAANSGAALQAELAEVQAERADTSRLWPALMIGVGSAGVLTGAGVGLGYVLTCDSQDCGVPAWVAIMVVAGGLLAAPGVVWLVNTNHNLAQLDMKAAMLQQEIERFRVRSALDRRELALGRPPSLLTLRFSL